MGCTSGMPYVRSNNMYGMGISNIGVCVYACVRGSIAQVYATHRLHSFADLRSACPVVVDCGYVCSPIIVCVSPGPGTHDDSAMMDEVSNSGSMPVSGSNPGKGGGGGHLRPQSSVQISPTVLPYPSSPTFPSRRDVRRLCAR